MRNSKSSCGLLFGLAAVVTSLIWSCSTDRTTGGNENLPPETHLFLQFSDTLRLPGETTSMQVLYWYGDDPDGKVVGYEYMWDYDTAWTYTIGVMDTFFVPITQPQDTFTFFIRAVDNSGEQDPTPDHLSFPIKNSPPVVSFPVDFIQRYFRNTYSCFSYFSIGWRGSDPDGDATITRYEWYLTDASFDVQPDTAAVWDTVSWNVVDSLTGVKVFSDLQPGSYRFFLRCRDVADAYSKIIFYPDTTAGAAWNVMPARGTVLYVDDNNYFFTSDSVNIHGALTELYGADGYSTWNVTDRISYYPRDIEATLRLFDKVVWNGSSYPHFREASNSITAYLAGGGHLFAFSTHARSDTLIYPFLPIDSVTTTSISRLFSIFRRPTAPATYPDTLSSAAPISYSYAFAEAPPAGLLPAPTEPLYYFVQGSDTLTVAARYPAHSESQWAPAQVVYFSLYVFDCNLNNRFYDLMRLILQEEFEDAGR